MKNRIYNFNPTYIKTLIKYSDKSNRKIASDINRHLSDNKHMNTNILYSKLSGNTKIYIEEAILLANSIKVPVEDIFCPTSKIMGNVMYHMVNLEEFTPYREFRISQKNINKYMLEREIIVEDIAYLFSLKTVSIYEKIKGNTKITVEEGILLSQLLKTNINDLFCPCSK